MKSKQVYSVVIVFAMGLILGTILEKSYGVKNTLKSLGVGSQTSSQGYTAEVSEGGILEEHQGKLKLFILAGQSNMSGMGELPNSRMATHPRIYVFGNDYHWKLAKEPMDDPRNQVDSVSEDQSAGFSPAMSFANTLLEQHPEMVIGLIPCAKGGSSIHEWRRQLNDNTLYGSCLKRIRAALMMGEVAGFLYFQGEIDAIDPKEDPQRTFLSRQWADAFAILIRDWRRDLNLPELPVVFAQIGTNTEPKRFKNWDVVKKQQCQVRLPFSVMVTTDDLPLQDYVHFTTASYQIIGQCFDKAYMQLLEMSRNGQKLGRFQLNS
ncbi:MAG: sialate O-acetylesterase [Acaryochloridaceae cyanobacterium SU_2_1]|nr:sialate O-acetylesterase [Acaryochloridaceae cyanobacterium SU_2_1]